MVCIIAMAVLLGVSAAWGSWSSATGDQYISLLGGIYAIYAPALAAGPQGQLYCAWVQRLPSSSILEVFFSKSIDNGQSWSGSSGDVQISTVNNVSVYNFGIFGDRRLDIAVDGEGRIFVVWPEKYSPSDSTEIIMVYSTDGGNTWVHSDLNFPISDTLHEGNANRPAMAIDHNDNIHVVWSQTDTVLVGAKADVYYSRSTDHGVTWSGRNAEKLISYKDSSAFQPHIAVGPDNKIHVVWKEKNDATYNINYGVSTDGGNTFSSETADRPICPSFGVTSYGNPRIAVGTTGIIHGVYNVADSAYYFGSIDGGANWNTTRIWQGVGYDFYNIDVAATASGYAVAIIDEEYPGLPDTRALYALYSSNNGTTWTTSLDPVTFNDGGQFDRSYIPDIVVTNGDTLHTTYYTNYPSSSNSYQEIAYSRNDNFLSGLTGTLSGHVYELDGITPISGVHIEVRDALNALVASGNTSGAGYYSYFLVPGTYSAKYTKYAYHDSTITNIVIIIGNTTTLNVNLRPVVPGTISGIVYEQSGTIPQEGVVVRAYDSLAVLRGTDTTDYLGAYSFNLNPDRYSVFFHKTNFYDTTVVNQVLIEAGSIILDVNLTWSIPPDDIGPISIDEPVDYMILGTAYTPAVTIRNHGYQSQIFDLRLKILYSGTIQVYNQTITGITLASLTDVQQVFGLSYTPNNAGLYVITAITTNPGDFVPGNDTLISSVICYAHQGQGGPDAFGYYFRDNTVTGGPLYSWKEISTTGTMLSPTLHYFMTEIPIGFTFSFYGTDYTNAWVNSHGQIHLGMLGNWLMSNDCPLPDTSMPHAPMAAIFWDYLKIQYEIGQGVYYQYFDEPTNDYTVIQWKASRYNLLNDSLEFEIILYQDSSLLFQYKYVSSGDSGRGESATVGLEYDVLPSGISYLCNNDNPANRLVGGLAIKWATHFGSPCQYLQGDINGDGLRGGGDVTYGVRFFKLIGNRPPDSCYMDSTGGYLYVAGDVNGNCEFRGSDISRLVAYFKLLIGLSYCHFFPPPPVLLLKNELIGKTSPAEK
jgi:hypothetical protein